MSEAPRRKRFQIHLSTAVVMMIAAGVLIWANVTKSQGDSFEMLGFETHLYGWPFNAKLVRIDDSEYIDELYGSAQKAVNPTVNAAI